MLFPWPIVEVISCNWRCVKILAQKLGTIDTNCPLCKEEFESGTHFFFKCVVARAVWFALKSNSYQQPCGDCWAGPGSARLCDKLKHIIKLSPRAIFFANNTQIGSPLEPMKLGRVQSSTGKHSNYYPSPGAQVYGAHCSCGIPWRDWW